MRKTELQFREDYTPGPYLPSVGYKGTKLSLEKASRVFSFSKSDRFYKEPSTSTSLFRLGPGSYETNKTDIEKSKRSVPIFVKPSNCALFTPKGYKFLGKQLVYTGGKRTDIVHISTANSVTSNKD